MRFRFFFFSSSLAVLLLSSAALADEAPAQPEDSHPSALSTYAAPEPCESGAAFRARLGADPPPYAVRIVREGDRYEGTATIATKGGVEAARSFASGTCDDVTRGLALAIGLVAAPLEAAPRPLALPPPPGLVRPTSVDEYRAALRALELRRKAATNPTVRDAIIQEERHLKVAYHEDTTLRSNPARITGFALGGLGITAIGASVVLFVAGRTFRECDGSGGFFTFCTKPETRDGYDRAAAITLVSGITAALVSVPLIVWGNARVMREAPVVKASFGPGSFALSGTF